MTKKLIFCATLAIFMAFSSTVWAKKELISYADLGKKWQKEYDIALSLRDKKAFEPAQEKLTVLLKKNPRFVQGFIELGGTFLMQRKLDQAVEQYIQAINLDQNNQDAYFHLAYIREGENRLEDALSLYAKARALDVERKNARVRFNMANIYAKLGKVPQAVALYKETLAVDGEYVDALVNLSLLYFKFDRMTEAAALLKRAIALGHRPDPQYKAALTKHIK